MKVNTIAVEIVGNDRAHRRGGDEELAGRPFAEKQVKANQSFEALQDTGADHPRDCAGNQLGASPRLGVGGAQVMRQETVGAASYTGTISSLESPVGPPTVLGPAPPEKMTCSTEEEAKQTTLEADAPNDSEAEADEDSSSEGLDDDQLQVKYAPRGNAESIQEYEQRRHGVWPGQGRRRFPLSEFHRPPTRIPGAASGTELPFSFQ